MSGRGTAERTADRDRLWKLLQEGPATTLQLAECTGRSYSSTHADLRRLERRGEIVSRPAAHDHSLLFCLTEKKVMVAMESECMAEGHELREFCPQELLWESA